MADEIDLANEQAERWLRQSLAARASGPALAPKGSCHYCETDFDPKDENSSKKLFCDSECSKGFEDDQRLRNRR